MKISEMLKLNISSEEAKDRKTKGNLKLLFSLYKGVKINWFAIILGAIIGIASSLVLFCVANEYYDIAKGTLESLAPLWKYLIFAGIQYVMILLSVVGDLAIVRVVTGVRKKLWKKMVLFPMKDYDEASPKGMLSRLTYDADFAAKPFNVIVLTLTVVLSIGSLFAIYPDSLPTARPIILITVILAAVLVVVSLKVVSRAQMYLQSRISLLTAHYAEQFSNIKFVKATNTEKKSIERSRNYIESRYEAARYNAVATGLTELAKNAVYIVTYAAAFLGGILAIRSGKIAETTPIQETYAYFVSVAVTFASVIALPETLANGIGGIKKLSMLMKGETEDKTAGRELEAAGDITLKDVTFSYSETGKNTLCGVSAVISEGKVTAIVGYNGSGKTTLTRIIDRLYPIGNGEIMIGENRAEDISLQSWRNRFGIVTQKTQLFQGSIRDNICYGLAEPLSDEKLQEIIRKARLDKVVEERGLDYDIGVSGMKLSGGEQQRVAIARAMAKDPEYLILDEATANLDAKTEKEIQEGLRELMQGRTVIVIAHSFSVIENADQILVMKDGSIEDSGSPADLLGRNSFVQIMHNEALAGK